MRSTYSTDGPKCPYCGHENHPDDPAYFDESFVEDECGECGKKFRVEVFTQVSWTCRPTEEGKT